jgi:hypothetical protein
MRVGRNPKKGRYERGWIESILDRGLVAHVARSTTRSMSAGGRSPSQHEHGQNCWKRHGNDRVKPDEKLAGVELNLVKPAPSWGSGG